mmetsp:Transcript_48003/g.148122  ORF Transcript_48003/g.148122 Transcript_48003/m.148122 type:complete len:219 (-) Transcript_48003:105-761(-)
MSSVLMRQQPSTRPCHSVRVPTLRPATCVRARGHPEVPTATRFLCAPEGTPASVFFIDDAATPCLCFVFPLRGRSFRVVARKRAGSSFGLPQGLVRTVAKLSDCPGEDGLGALKLRSGTVNPSATGYMEVPRTPSFLCPAAPLPMATQPMEAPTCLHTRSTSPLCPCDSPTRARTARARLPERRADTGGIGFRALRIRGPCCPPRHTFEGPRPLRLVP